MNSAEKAVYVFEEKTCSNCLINCNDDGPCENWKEKLEMHDMMLGPSSFIFSEQIHV